MLSDPNNMMYNKTTMIFRNDTLGLDFTIWEVKTNTTNMTHMTKQHEKLYTFPYE